MYLLFREHHLLPSDYLKLPEGERLVLKTFMLKQAAPKALESVCWQVQRARLEQEEGLSDA